MENSLLSLAEKLSPDVSYCIIWLNDDGILFDHKSKNVNEMIEMLYMLCQAETIIENIYEEMGTEDAAKIREAMTLIKGVMADEENQMDTLPLLQPISMSKQ